MRLSEDHPLDPQVLAELEAIDATLRGEAVDPDHAELAELALLLADQREPMPADAARSLDAAVARRFAPAPSTGAAQTDVGDDSSRRPPRDRSSRRPRLTRWALRPSFGAALAGVAAVAVAGVVVLGNQPGGAGPSVYNSLTPPTGAPANGGAASSGGESSHSLAGTHPAPRQPAATPALTTPRLSSTNGGISSSAAGSANGSGSTRSYSPPPSSSPATQPPTAQLGAALGSSGSLVPTPPGNGRKVLQAAQLQLSASGNRIAVVSQELFNVVGLYRGIVKSSQITAAGANGYAYFQLSIPSANLQQTLSALSTLRYAHIVSRTDATQDVNGQYNALVRQLGDDRALRTALLKQLANATTQAQIASLQTQIKDAEAAISRDQAALGALDHQINFSAVDVQINAAPIVPVTSTGTSSRGFTLGTAWHDAIHVLTVAAGVSLIALAALIPLGLLAAVIAWIAYWVRRRRREAALDAA